MRYNSPLNSLKWIFLLGSLELQPSLPRLAVAPVWEPPYRRGKNDVTNECEVKDWIPNFEQVSVSYVFFKLC